MKTLVNEPVAGIFALTKEEKTEWKERLVERRLGEAQKLVSKGNLSEKTRIGLENQIKNKIDEFNINVNELALQKNESTDSSDLNIRLQASLKAYQNVLENLSGETSVGVDTKQETEKLLATLEVYKNKVKDNHKNLELNVGVDSNAAENLLNSTKLTYQKEKINLSINIQNQIDAKLALAETTLQEGKVFITSSNYTNATDKFQTTINAVNKVKLLMLSNVMKGDIENEMGTKENSNDIEDDQFDDVEENDINSSELKSVKSHSNEFKSDEISPSEFDIED